MIASLLALLAIGQEPAQLPGLPKAKVTVLAVNKRNDRAIGTTATKVCLFTKTRSGWKMQPLMGVEKDVMETDALFDLEQDHFLVWNVERSGVNSTSSRNYAYRLTPTGCAKVGTYDAFENGTTTAGKHRWTLTADIDATLLLIRGRKLVVRDVPHKD